MTKKLLLKRYSNIMMEIAAEYADFYAKQSHISQPGDSYWEDYLQSLEKPKKESIPNKAIETRKTVNQTSVIIKGSDKPNISPTERGNWLIKESKDPWEIMLFRDISSRTLLKPYGVGNTIMYTNKYRAPVAKTWLLLFPNEYSIISVRRVDGFIFTVGEIIISPMIGRVLIREFRVINNEMIVFFNYPRSANRNNENPERRRILLRNISKI